VLSHIWTLKAHRSWNERDSITIAGESADAFFEFYIPLDYTAIEKEADIFKNQILWYCISVAAKKKCSQSKQKRYLTLYNALIAHENAHIHIKV